MYLLEALCSDKGLENVLYLVGIVMLAIRIIVPLLLIVTGMITLVKALTAQDGDATKSATKSLVMKVVAAVIVFLIPAIISFLMTVLEDTDWEGCSKCVLNPFDCTIDW